MLPYTQCHGDQRTSSWRTGSNLKAVSFHISTSTHTFCHHVNEQAEATLLPANNIMMKTVRTAFDGDPLIMNNSILVWISAFRWKSSDTCSRDLLRIPMTPMMMIRTAFDGDPRDSREPVIPNHFSFSTPPQTTASPPPTWKCNLVAGAKLCPLLLKWSYKNHEFFVFSIFDISMLVPCAHKSQTLDSNDFFVISIWPQLFE